MNHSITPQPTKINTLFGRLNQGTIAEKISSGKQAIVRSILSVLYMGGRTGDLPMGRRDRIGVFWCPLNSGYLDGWKLSPVRAYFGYAP